MSGHTLHTHRHRLCLGRGNRLEKLGWDRIGVGKIVKDRVGVGTVGSERVGEGKVG